MKPIILALTLAASLAAPSLALAAEQVKLKTGAVSNDGGHVAVEGETCTVGGVLVGAFKPGTLDGSAIGVVCPSFPVGANFPDKVEASFTVPITAVVTVVKPVAQ